MRLPLNSLFAVFTCLLCFSTVVAQNAVVVVPLGGDDINQCEVITRCESGQVTVSCPSGEKQISCPTKTVFVTSSTHTGNLGGLAGADAICQGLADDAGLDGTYLAWLSSTTESPSTRFARSNIQYALVNKERIADNYDDLTEKLESFDTADLLDTPINLTETGNFFATEVWTQTIATGVSSSGGLTATCSDWTSSIIFGGIVGNSEAQDGFWSTSAIKQCSEAKALYCFEQ